MKKRILSLVMTILMVMTVIVPIWSPVYAEGTDGITTSSGETNFPLNSPGVVIDSDLCLSGFGDITGAKVMIRNLQYGDKLTADNFNGISFDFNQTNGVLTFTGSKTQAQYQEVLRTVKFTTSSNNEDKRIIDFIIGTGVYFSENGHFYEYIQAPSISWNDAVKEAEKKTLSGHNGYLVTITSAAENEFVLSKTEGIGWIGARDINRDPVTGEFLSGNLANGDWRWVTGPEGLEDSGKGQKFYSGYCITGGSPVAGKYVNWDGGEPNNYSSSEWVAHIFPSIGTWNDYNPRQSCNGYIVEYNGMAEGQLKLQATKVVSIGEAKAVQEAPTGLAGVAPTVYSGSDGKITGITTGSAIEYKLSTDINYISASGPEITGLVSGTYNVRYAETVELGAGLDATVVVPEGQNTGIYTVSGTVKDEDNAAKYGVAVKLMSGVREIANTITDVSGNFSMGGITNGTYNLVISKGIEQTITLAINVSGKNVATGIITLPRGNKNSVLEVTGDNTPEIVVDGLNKFFISDKFTSDDENLINNGGKIEIKLSVEKKSDNDAENAVKIRTLAGNTKTIGIFLDLTLNKTVTTGSAITTSGAITGTFPIKELNDVLSIYIPLPAELQGKSGYVIYRYHGDKVDTITEEPNLDGEKIELSADLKSIKLYTKKFSTYAIAYTAATSNNNDRDKDKDNVPVIVPVDINTDHKIIIKKDVKKSTLPYYMQDGNKIFIGFTANSEDVLKYIASKGETVELSENPKSFSDIENHWAKANIDFVTEREIFEGTSKNTFAPQTSMTRAMFVTVVGRLYERSYGNVKGESTFSDVDMNAYYAKYVAWANENGIIKGIGGNKFAPDAEVTREQMSEIMFNFATFLGKAPQGDWMINVTYKDKANISDWAMDSAAYCQLTSIISGRDGGEFAPKATATRAEVSAVIERFVNEILNK